MKNRRLMYSIIIVICIVISFFIGEVTENIKIGHEGRRIESLKGEATTFFYKTIRELYTGTYDPNDRTANEYLQKEFKDSEFKAKFNPICHLGSLDVQYGDTFYGWVYSQSENVFEVEILRINGKWYLAHISKSDAKWFWHDLREDKKA